jgi:amino-acid N-acetyltransferase
MNNHKEYQLIPVKDNLKQKVIALLQESNLPISDLDEQKELFALLQNNEVAGTAGLEFFDNCALLRSVSVRKDLQGNGLGKFINHELEKISRQRGVDCLYLLTTTARDFFGKEGYEVISRDDVPESIKGTSEFSSVCPSSATVMKKDLA